MCAVGALKVNNVMHVLVGKVGLLPAEHLLCRWVHESNPAIQVKRIDAFAHAAGHSVCEIALLAKGFFSTLLLGDVLCMAKDILRFPLPFNSRVPIRPHALLD